jgi:hypothetical protein
MFGSYNGLFKKSVRSVNRFIIYSSTALTQSRYILVYVAGAVSLLAACFLSVRTASHKKFTQYVLTPEILE